MRQGTLGAAGERVVIEECLDGDELSFIVLADSRGILPLAPSQDYKPVFDHDEGPNTGGMGASSHDAIISSLERDVASLSLRIAELKVDFSAMQSRLDIMDRRIDRIERRLELADLSTPS